MTTRKVVHLEADEISTLVFGALTRLEFAACLLIALEPGNPADCRAWLKDLAPLVSFGPTAPDKPACVLAMTESGLRRLELAEGDLATFPAAFVNGMTSAPRARALGDVNCRAPKWWEWGNDRKRVDVAIVVYASSAANLETSIAAIETLNHAASVTVGPRICLQTRRRGEKEPFGFRDGLSQPIIPGTPAARRDPTSDQIVAAGEFVLGYDDNRGFMPPVPTVARADPYGSHLAQLPGGRADLGRNSSFLVIRQLRQDVEGFRSWIADRAREWNTSPDFISAKMIGRWRNGSSLVRHPTHPGEHVDNDFRFGAEDPDGLHCPLGAHIRRANPRDSLRPDIEDPIAITDRHRILRVGRPYVLTQDGPPEGLLFMCLNADIERQFEFIQQSWLLRPSFAGLRDELDPLIGANGGSGSLTVPTELGPSYLRGLSTFVTPIGGGYFWLPGRSAVEYLAHI
jgi:deferrochelatase/peroxidase EfeB